MNREQAAEINRHLLRAANAIRRAEAIMWDLDQTDRRAFAEPLGNTVTALHFELLQVIYRQFPDLGPPDKGWRRIDSKLTWKQVQLPASVTVMDFDRVILSTMSHHWRKTARIVGDVSEHYASHGISLDPAIAAARLMAMVVPASSRAPAISASGAIARCGGKIEGRLWPELLAADQADHEPAADDEKVAAKGDLQHAF